MLDEVLQVATTLGCLNDFADRRGYIVRRLKFHISRWLLSASSIQALTAPRATTCLAGGGNLYMGSRGCRACGVVFA